MLCLIFKNQIRWRKIMQPIVFLNTAWMEYYEGLIGSDNEIHGGGSYVEKYGYGHEIYNFKKIKGKVYGYAQPGGSNNLERLGAQEDADYLEGVLTIFTATHKDGGTYIVGWYKDATFFRDYQETKLKERKFKNEYIGYYAVAKEENAVLLSIDERFSFPIPRGVKGGMGQSNVWYADSEEMKDFRVQVFNKIKKYEQEIKKSKKINGNRSNNVEDRKKIEDIAIKQVTKKYMDLGYDVKSVEQENLGWDLEAFYKKTKLRIEVKGLSGNNISVEITPNEYSMMNQYLDRYRLCIVTNCLNDPSIHTFSFSNEKKCWRNEDGEALVIDQIISARCYI